MITPDSPIAGYVESGGYSFPADARHPAEVVSYAEELRRLCELVGFDFRILFAQAWHETAGFTSDWWTERLNPAGIGITGDPAQNAASHTWANGTDAARAHVAHMWAYVEGTTGDAVSNAYKGYDPRFQNVFDAGYDGTVRTLNDLTGKWATDPRYAEKIAAKANQIFTEEPMATPVIYELWKDYARFGLTQAEANRILDNKFVGRRDGSIQGRPTHRLCHIQAGTTVSSLDWWANGPGVQASSTVMIQRDGSILRVIPEADGPWTNGDDYAPKPAGQALVNQPGNSNIWTLSIEAEGMTGAEVLQYPAQMDAIEWQLREWARKYPETAPMDHLLEHADLQRIQKPNCAGAYYPVIRQRLTAGPAPQYAEPVGWPSKQGDVGIITVGAAKARLVTCEVECTKPNGTIPRAYASSKAGQSGPKIPQGKKVTVIATVTVPGDKRPSQWHVLSTLDRVGASGFTPALPKA